MLILAKESAALLLLSSCGSLPKDTPRRRASLLLLRLELGRLPKHAAGWRRCLLLGLGLGRLPKDRGRAGAKERHEGRDDGRAGGNDDDGGANAEDLRCLGRLDAATKRPKRTREREDVGGVSGS